jgi:hypothetical protein
MPLIAPSHRSRRGVRSRALVALAAVLAIGLAAGSNPAIGATGSWSRVVASDSFGRTVDGSWGVAEAGGLYSYEGWPYDFGVAPGQGMIWLPGPGASRTAHMFSTLARDIDVAVTYGADHAATGSGVYFFTLLRRATNGSSYVMKLRFGADGLAYGQISRRSGSADQPLTAEAQLVAGPVSIESGLRIRARASGVNPTTLSFKAWLPTDVEPSAWTMSVTDSTAELQAAGSIGFRAYASSSSDAPYLATIRGLDARTRDAARLTGTAFVGAGDIASCASDRDSGTARLVGMLSGTVFTAGDTAYPEASAERIASCYEPTWGSFKARTRPAVGDEEYEAAPDAAPYFDYFGPAAGTNRLGYYAYNVGSWRVYVLNSNCSFVACNAGSAQESWLRRNIAANPKRCSIAIWHHPRYSSAYANASNNSVQALWKAFADAGGDIVISGHDHDYERFGPMDGLGAASATGVREFVVGTGGSGLRSSMAPAIANSEVHQWTSYGVLRFVLGDGKYEWEFVPVAGQTFTDRGSGACHG